MNVFNPLLSVMRLSLTVGLGEVLQHIPRSVMVAPPVELICPPQNAEYSVMSETGRVETLGKNTGAPSLRTHRTDMPLDLSP